MSQLDALRYLLEPVPDAITSAGDSRGIVDWNFLFNDEALARLSDGERALVYLALQLYNGGSIDPGGRINLHTALGALDATNRHRFVHAIGLAYDEHWQLMSADPATITTTRTKHR